MELSVQTQTLTFDYIEAVIDRLQNSAVSSRKGDIKMIPKPEKLRDKCVSWMCLLHLGKKNICHCCKSILIIGTILKQNMLETFTEVVKLSEELTKTNKQVK